ncbi:MAG: FAD-dependent oxidoreductase [Candidatus Flemingiibacterium sp.]
MANFITEPEREIPVLGECDVLVCGGGIAGISSALAAARNGAKVILIEREFMLGGLATLGLVTIYLPLCDGEGTQVSFGIADELLHLSIARGVIEDKYPGPWLEGGSKEERAKRRFEVQYNPNIFACDAEKLLVDSGVEIIYGTVAAAAVVEDGRITSVVVENKSGRSAISAKAVVDCTGDADICKLSGEETALFSKGNVLAAWYYRYSEQSGVKLKMLGFADIAGDAKQSAVQQLIPRRFKGIDAKEISEMEILSHQRALADAMKLRETDGSTVPVIFPTIPQLRMTRKLVGAAIPTDQPTHKFEETSIGLYSDWRKSGPVYELPYGSLYGNRVKNLITAGRNISVSDELWDVTRVIPVCAVSGEAAGTAAAMASAAGKSFSELDVKALQKRLSDAGVKLHCPEVGLANKA